MATVVDEDAAFELVTGVPESKWDFKIESLPKQGLDVGKFETPTISELDGRIDASAIPPGDKCPVLNVRLRTRGHIDLFDTSALQVSGPQHALYQVASNFNTLENPHAAVNVLSGRFLTNMMSDSTQGPSAAGGALLGAVLRLAEYRKAPINLLSKTPLPQDNGKLSASRLCEFDAQQIQIGLHTDIRATFDRSRYNHCLYVPNGPLIDQVLTSTCIHPHTQEDCAPFLKAAYDGTYAAAVLRRSPRVVLTLIGGGVFRNSLSAIGAAIASAHRKYGPKLVAGCEVMLPVFDPRSGVEFVRKLAKYMKPDEEFVVERIEE